MTRAGEPHGGPPPHAGLPCEPGDHVLLVTYRRPWRQWFRRELILRCWHCVLEVRDPG